MPPFAGRGFGSAGNLLQTRDDHQPPAQQQQSNVFAPGAFAFLVPVFVIALITPFICVWVIRKRHQDSHVVAPAARLPILRRSEARERLNLVTVVSVPVCELKPADDRKTENLENAEGTRGAGSILERECAICLSTLHAPSPPEQAALRERHVTDGSEESASIITSPSREPETILRLQICGHEFHSECLVSWSVLRKTSCPICRAEYYSKEAMQLHDTQASSATQPAQSSVTTPPPPSNWSRFIHDIVGSRQPAHVDQAQSTIQIP